MAKEYSVKDIADIIEVSKTTIRKAIQSESIEYDHIKSNKQLYSEEKAKKIIESIKPDFDFANSEFKFANSNFENTNSDSNVEFSQTQSGNSQPNTANSQSAELQLLQQTLELLGKQLEEKDKQLQQKDNQIEALNERLKEAMALTQQQNYITATDKTTQLLEAQAGGMKDKSSNVEAVKPTDRKSVFAKLFSK